MGFGGVEVTRESSTARGVGTLSPHTVRGSTARVLCVCFLWSRGSIHARSGVAPRHALCILGVRSAFLCVWDRGGAVHTSSQSLAETE